MLAMQGSVRAGTAEATKPSFRLLPAVGEHMLRFQGRQVWISRSEKRSELPSQTLARTTTCLL